MWTMKSAALVAIALWVVILIYLSSQLFGIQGRTMAQDEKMDELIAALGSLKTVQRQNQELRDLIEAERRENAARRLEERQGRQVLLDQLAKHGDKDDVIKSEVHLPEVQFVPIEERNRLTVDHEVTRRLLDRNIWEIFYLMHNAFKQNNEFNKLYGKHTENQLLSLLALSSNFSTVDGAADYRKSQLQEITNKIQDSIDRIQNPDDCSKTRALVCVLDKECGFGCQLHHVTYCFVTAFGSQRTLILKDNGTHWRYSHKGWTGGFKAITKCDHRATVGSETIPPYDMNSTSRVVALGIVDGMSNKPPFLPLSFPKKLEQQLLTLHSNPPAFFISQFIWYLMRSNSEVDKILKNAISQIPFNKGPVVGLQIRRTDKIGTEAAFHSVDEYMEWTEIWFQIEERKQGEKLQRRVYIATDDPNVVPEAKKKYDNYEVYGDISIANTAQLGKRYSDASLHGVLTDIRLLSLCDYLVCTFSSQVCRMGYELMQVHQGDAGEKFHSLDDLYYYGGQFPHEQIAIEDYVAETNQEIDLKTGDVIGIAGNHWNGYSKGQNRRTGKIGLYPSYMAIEKWRVVDFPGDF